MPTRKFRMACVLLIACALVAVSVTKKTSAARIGKQDGKQDVKQDAARRDADLDQVFRKRELFKLAPARAAEQVRATGRVTLSTGDKTYQLVLEPHDMRAPGYRAEEKLPGGAVRAIEPDPVNTYRGSVTGMENAVAAFTIDGENFEGLILTPDASYFVEPARRYSTAAAADDILLYNSADVLKGANVSCGNETLNERLDAAVQGVAARATAAPEVQAFNLRLIELATDADNEYVTLAGGTEQANSEIRGIMNQVDLVYRREIGVTFAITFQNAWATADPYDNSSQVNLLNSFKNYWNTNFTNVQRDLAHLWSGAQVISLSGLTFVGQVCNTQTPGNAYGIHGRVVDAPQKFILSAHEIGHSLGAPAAHPDTAPGCAGTIMASSSGPNSVLTFCQTSRDSITGYIAGHTSCMSVITVRPRFDFDGDGKADLAVFRPSTSFWYYFNSANGGFNGQPFGAQGDLAAPEDYDGDGRADLAVFRPTAGSWYLLQSRAGFAGKQFGANGDKPVAQDYDGDGAADVAVYRPSTGAWYVLNSGNGSVTGLFFGAIGDLPAPADFDGDGRADIAVFRPSNGTWYIQQSRAGFRADPFGQSGDRPVPADFDGDGRADLALFRPQTGGWYIQQSTLGFKGIGFGGGTDLPVPADFDGDGKIDIAVWRNTDGGWYILNSLDGSFRATAFGTQGDVPAPGAYVP
ncbi:MAG: VCBS repeat-containing protein [Acidobacteria bacterium]|nr:VCBS repeat-containing protein [Acidobacteriota bacterium]